MAVIRHWLLIVLMTAQGWQSKINGDQPIDFNDPDGWEAANDSENQSVADGVMMARGARAEDHGDGE